MGGFSTSMRASGVTTKDNILVVRLSESRIGLFLFKRLKQEEPNLATCAEAQTDLSALARSLHCIPNTVVCIGSLSDVVESNAFGQYYAHGLTS